MLAYLQQVDLPALIIVVGLFLYVAILFKWHSDETAFDFRRSLVDPPEPGSVSLSRLGQLTALVVSSSVLVYFTIKGEVQEWMFATYMVAWAGTYIAAKFAPHRNEH